SLALGRLGSVSTDGSGDIFLAFSTANRIEIWDEEIRPVEMITDVDPLFESTVQAAEEAIVNALVSAETMEGIDGHVLHAIPLDRLREVLRIHGRLEE
ncbi:MAG: P1 family peptidase, partial [Thermoanaerobaculia bacterium]|nr:P1 family peptidase [Thermoanaerobaculia bacterium]